MRWSTTLAAWTRRETVLVAVLAVAAGIAVLAEPLHAPWLVLAGAAVGVATIAADVLGHAREVPLTMQSAAELGELRD